MELHVIQTIEELKEYETSWQGFLEKNHNSNPFIELYWIYTWWSIFGKQYDLYIVTVCENHESQTFFPFMKKKGIFIDHFYFIGYGQANYMDVVCKKRDLAKITEIVMRRLSDGKKGRLFQLHGLFEGGHFTGCLADYLQRSRIPNYQSKVISPVLRVNEISTDSYFKRRKKKHGLDRKERNLRKLGTVSFEPLRPDDIEKMFTLHQKRWEEKNDTSGFSKGKNKEFFHKLLQYNAGEIQTQADGLYLNDELIAFLYGFKCRSRYVFYLPGHDDEYSKFSPGRMIFKEKITDCKRLGLETFDMSIGYEPYKFDWSNGTEHVVKFIFPSRHMTAWIFFFFYAAKAKLVDQMKKNHRPVLFKRNFLGKLKSRLANVMPHWLRGKKG